MKYFVGLSSLLLLAGCAPKIVAPAKPAGYVAPAANEPRAEVEVRMRYHGQKADALSESIEVDGQRARGNRATKDIPSESARKMSVRPGKKKLTLKSTFAKQTTQVAPRKKIVWEERYYPCAGALCKRMVPVEVTEDVPVKVETPIAACEAGVEPDVRAGGRYLLEYDFQAGSQCTLRCWELDVSGKKVPCSEEKRDATVAAATTAGVLPAVADVKRTEGPVFIRTERAGMQQVTPGERVKLFRTDGGSVVGKVVAANADGIVLDVGGNLELVVAAPQIAQVFKAK